MSVVSFINHANGPFLVPSNDTCLRQFAENHDLLNDTQVEFHRILTAIKEQSGNRKVVLDCGSNIGTFSIPLAKAHPDLMFHSFEIQRFIYYSFCGTIALQGLRNIEANLKGIGDKNYRLQIKIPDYTQLGNYGAFEARKPFRNSDVDSPIHFMQYSNDYTTVEVITIDSMNTAPIMIKLDIEGMEYPALVGAEQTIDLHEPVIYLERHKSNEKLIFDFFENKPYSMRLANDNHFFFVPNRLLTVLQTANIF